MFPLQICLLISNLIHHSNSRESFKCIVRTVSNATACMETDMTDRAQDPIFKQSTCPHSWDIRDNPSLHLNFFLQRGGPVVGGNLEEVYSVKKASALLAHHLASSIFTGRNQVLSLHTCSELKLFQNCLKDRAKL